LRLGSGATSEVRSGRDIASASARSRPGAANTKSIFLAAHISRPTRAAWKRFEKKWSKKCPGVVKSLVEGGDELLTFFRYPESMWKAIRTTNCFERMNSEFRRRVKAQGSLPNTDAGLKLLFGLFACGLISMRRLDGWRELPAAVAQKRVPMGLVKTSDNADNSGDSIEFDKVA